MDYSTTMISHEFSLRPAFARIAETVQLWRRRAGERAELARFSERDLQDIGLTSADRSFLFDKALWHA